MSEQRKQSVLQLFPIFILLLGMICLSALYLHTYRQIAFEHISAFCEIMRKSDPELEQRILSSLKAYHSLTEQEVKGNSYLERYGYRREEFCKGLSWDTAILVLIVFLIITSAFLLSIRYNDQRNKKRIAELTDYLECINIGVDGMRLQTQEDMFSHLQDEIYKTVTALCQRKETAMAARENVADNLANIAHQLKTPITVSFLSLQLMRKDISNPYVDQIETQLARLNYLEESLLTLSRIDAGTLLLKHMKVDTYTVLNLAAENLNELLEEEHISVVIQDKGCVEFWGDLEWTMEALINLLKNCMEHSLPGGQIHCDYTENPLYVQILIWDEGTGFAEEDIPHLFERFYRGRHVSGNGTGIGLALARSIIELQNGTITAKNLQDDGACFEINIYCH